MPFLGSSIYKIPFSQDNIQDSGVLGASPCGAGGYSRDGRGLGALDKEDQYEESSEGEFADLKWLA